MRNRRLIVLVFALLLITFAAILLFLPSSEPTYQGRTVTQWLQDYGTNGLRPGGDFPGKTLEFNKAIQHFGTNAIPYLMKSIKYWPPFYRSSNTLVRIIYRNKFIAKSVDEKEWRGASAQRAFLALGTNANPAVPLLLNCLQDKTASIRRRALVALSYIKLQPETVIPALLRRIPEEQNPGICVQMVRIITSYGEEGTRVLEKLKRGSDPELRQLATNMCPPDIKRLPL